MELKIDSRKKISTIKEEFNAAFPFLRLEFFNHKHRIKNASPKRDLILKDIPLNEFKTGKHPNYIEISDEMQVQTLEQMIQDEFGISMQVFRKSGKSWLETSVTDDWTLRRQNDEGMELSQFNR